MRKNLEQLRAEAREKMRIDGYMTEDGYERLKESLEECRGPQMKEVLEELDTARSYGDLSENAEYEYWKDRKYELMVRIRSLEEEIESAQVLTKEEWEVKVLEQIKELEDKEREKEAEGRKRLATITIDEIVEDYVAGSSLSNGGTWNMGEIPVPTGKFYDETVSIYGFYSEDYQLLLSYTPDDQWSEKVREAIDCFIKKDAYFHAYTALIGARYHVTIKNDKKELWTEELEWQLEKMSEGQVYDSEGYYVGYMEHRMSGTTYYYLNTENKGPVLIGTFEAEYEEAPEESLHECYTYVEF